MLFFYPSLRLGYLGPEVGNWQRFLASQGRKDAEGRDLEIDEDFGPRTEGATKDWQAKIGLVPTGHVDEADRHAALSFGYVPFVRAENFTPCADRTIRLLVLHTMEAPEKPGTAEEVAAWFAGLGTSPAPRASAHYLVDDGVTLQAVRERDVAWHAPGANAAGIGIEHAGFAQQTPIEWQDAYSKAILWRSASLVGKLAAKYQIPLVHLTPGEIRDGGAGICGHVDVTNAFPELKGTHWDPGPSFPWTEYLGLCASLARVAPEAV